MGTVFVDNLEPQSGTTLTLGASGDAINLASGATAGFGKIGQMVSTSLTTTVSTSSSTLVASGFSVSITPSSTSSKIFLSLSCNVYINTDPYGYVGFFRGTTNLGGSNHGMFTISQADKYMPMTFQHLDSPSSTSSITYNVYYKKSGSNNIYLNPTAGEGGSGVPDGATGVFTAMEILP